MWSPATEEDKANSDAIYLGYLNTDQNEPCTAPGILKVRAGLHGSLG